MHIPEYQILNVLKTFTGRLLEKHPMQGAQSCWVSPDIDTVKRSPGVKRQAISAKVAGDIFSRISRFGIQGADDGPAGYPTSPPHGSRAMDAIFTFNAVDTGNRKTTHRLPVKDPHFIPATRSWPFEPGQKSMAMPGKRLGISTTN